MGGGGTLLVANAKQAARPEKKERTERKGRGHLKMKNVTLKCEMLTIQVERASAIASLSAKPTIWGFNSK